MKFTINCLFDQNELERVNEFEGRLEDWVRRMKNLANNPITGPLNVHRNARLGVTRIRRVHKQYFEDTQNCIDCLEETGISRVIQKEQFGILLNECDRNLQNGIALIEPILQSNNIIFDGECYKYNNSTGSDTSIESLAADSEFQFNQKHNSTGSDTSIESLAADSEFEFNQKHNQLSENDSGSCNSELTNVNESSTLISEKMEVQESNASKQLALVKTNSVSLQVNKFFYHKALKTRYATFCPVLVFKAEPYYPRKFFLGVETHVLFNPKDNLIPNNSIVLTGSSVRLSFDTYKDNLQYCNRFSIGYSILNNKNVYLALSTQIKKNGFSIKGCGLEAYTGVRYRLSPENAFFYGGELKAQFLLSNNLTLKNSISPSNNCVNEIPMAASVVEQQINVSPSNNCVNEIPMAASVLDQQINECNLLKRAQKRQMNFHNSVEEKKYFTQVGLPINYIDSAKIKPSVNILTALLVLLVPISLGIFNTFFKNQNKKNYF